MLCSPYFKELFQTRSSAQPRLIFGIEKREKRGLWCFFSLPQHQSPCEKSPSSSLVVTAKFLRNFPPDNMRIQPADDRKFSCGYASGLIYFYGLQIEADHHDGVPVICNPITGRYATLPFVYRYRKAFSFLGFDPIDKQYKVLFMAYPFGPDHHKIVTLGTGEMRVKRIKGSLRHEIVSEGICINGVLYYLGDTSDCMPSEDYLRNTPSPAKGFVIVCFDVRSEKFNFIDTKGLCQLINYKGKLGVISYDDHEFRLSVLEDVEKQEWSKYSYNLINMPKQVSAVGVTAVGEIVSGHASISLINPFVSFITIPKATPSNVLTCKVLENTMKRSSNIYEVPHYPDEQSDTDTEDEDEDEDDEDDMEDH